MIKNLGYKLAILGGLASCFIGVAQAAHVDHDIDDIDDSDDDGYEFDDVVFIGLPDDLFPDVACAPFDDPLYTAPRSVTFTLSNNEPSFMRLFDVRMIPFANDNSGVRATFYTGGADNCLDFVDGASNYGQGGIPAYEQCFLTVQFIPPFCELTGQEGAPVPMSARIHQLLSIGVGSQEDHLLLENNAEVNVIGSGNEFAVLGYNQPPINQGNNNSQLYGHLGVMESLPELGFTLPNSATAFGDPLNPIVLGTESDFMSAYDTLLAGVDFGDNEYCIPYGDMDLGDILTTGSYCMFDAHISEDDPPVVTPVDVVVDGDVILSGPGDFFFFLDPNKHCLLDDVLTYRMCYLEVGPNFNVVYDADQNGDRPSPENVFWILGAVEEPSDNTAIDPPLVLGSTDFNHVYISNGARFDGSILGGAGTFFTPGVPEAVPPVPDQPACAYLEPIFEDDVLVGYTVIGPVGNNIIVEYTTGDRGANINGSLWTRCGLIELAGTSMWPAHSCSVVVPRE